MKTRTNNKTAGKKSATSHFDAALLRLGHHMLPQQQQAFQELKKC